MFNVGGGEMLVIFLLALLVLGPDKLPESARKIGRVLTELRRMSQGFQDEVRSAIDITGDSAKTSPGPRLIGGADDKSAGQSASAESVTSDTGSPDGDGNGAGGTNGSSAA